MCLKNDIIEFKENQMKPSDSTSMMDHTPKNFNMNFNNNNDKLLSLAYECQDDIAIIRKFYSNVISIISLRKYNSTDRVLTLMLAD